MNDTREDTGYTPIKREDIQRVPIADYGNKARADKAKEEVKELLKQLKIESKRLTRV